MSMHEKTCNDEIVFTPAEIEFSTQLVDLTVDVELICTSFPVWL